MTDDRAKRLAQLRQAYENGILDEDTYQAAVVALSAQTETQATVEGSGAVAQDGSAAATTGAVAVGGDVHGNVYVGQPTDDPVEALRIYRRVLVGTSSHLPLRGVDLGDSDPRSGQKRLGLAQVYVDLDTKTPAPLVDEEKKQRERQPSLGREETRLLRALEATTDNRRLVLLGDPGYGKSTFVGHLALCLAAERMDRLSGWPEDESATVPIPVVLRDFVRALADDAEQAERLQEAVRRSDLWRLAPNPLLLTVMALVHTHKGRLPDARALLYEDTVDILLWRWEQIKTGGDDSSPRMRQLLLKTGRTDVDLKRVLWQLAFQAHGEGGAGDGDDALADISEWRLCQSLAELHPENSLDWARDVISTIKLRAGLLLERAPEVYTFPHRTFQEYLAGAHLSAQADFARQAASLVEEGAFWREVVLLAVGRLVYLSDDIDKPLALVGELCPAQGIDNETAWQKAWLAGEALVEVGLNRVGDSALGQDLLARVRGRLAELLNKGLLSPVERAAAGRALAKLGDPRPGVGVVSPPLHAGEGPGVGALSDIAWCQVPEGSFLMGARQEDIPVLLEKHGGEWGWYEWETPQHECSLSAFRISKYPVTNAQYAAFVADGGYEECRYWSEAQTDGVWQAGRVKGFMDDEPRGTPYDFGEPFNLPNHPVVGVTWYEAVAFCHWLTEQLRETGEIRSELVKISL